MTKREKRKKLIIVGAGGFGRELLQWAKEMNLHIHNWEIKGFIDDNARALEGYICDYEVLGAIKSWEPSCDEVFACAIADPVIKEKNVNLLKNKGAKFEKMVHPTARIGEFNQIGEGVVMYPNSSITVNSKIGNFVTILSSQIGHDVEIGDYSTISSRCGINGKVKIGRRVFIGSNAVIVPGKKIGNDAFVSAGSVVIRNVKPKTKVFGNPARMINY